MTAKEIAKFIEDKYPKENAMEGDFVGLQVDSTKEKIVSVLVCLDPTFEMIKKAVSNNVDMIVSHHPLFFGEQDEIIEKSKFTKWKYEMLKENDIAYYSLHTNSDFAFESLSIWQAEKIGIKAIRHLDEKTFEGAYGTLKIKKEMLVKQLKSKFDLNAVNAYFNKNAFSKIAIASGASGYLLEKAQDMRCEVLITGEVKWHEWVMAKEMNISLVEIGHFTEGIFVDNIKKYLQSQVKTLISYENDGIYNTY